MAGSIYRKEEIPWSTPTNPRNGLSVAEGSLQSSYSGMPAIPPEPRPQSLSISSGVAAAQFDHIDSPTAQAVEVTPNGPVWPPSNKTSAGPVAPQGASSSQLGPLVEISGDHQQFEDGGSNRPQHEERGPSGFPYPAAARQPHLIRRRRTSPTQLAPGPGCHIHPGRSSYTAPQPSSTGTVHNDTDRPGIHRPQARRNRNMNDHVPRPGRRGSVLCSRCRRMKQGKRPSAEDPNGPCIPCIKAGVGEECGSRTLPVKKSIRPKVATNQRLQFLLTHSSTSDAALVALEAKKQPSIFVDQQPVDFPSLQLAKALADRLPEIGCVTTSPAERLVTSHESSEIGFGRVAQPVTGTEYITGFPQQRQAISDPIMEDLIQAILILFQRFGQERVNEAIFKLWPLNPHPGLDFTPHDIMSRKEFSQNRPEESFSDLEGTPGFSIIGTKPTECIQPWEIFEPLAGDGASDYDKSEDR